MLKYIWLSSLCLGLFAVLMCGQTGVGEIQGTVSDASGAVVPQAEVALENVQSQTRLRTNTSEVGFFSFPSLAPGEYRLTIMAAGMQVIERDDREQSEIWPDEDPDPGNSSGSNGDAGFAARQEAYRGLSYSGQVLRPSGRKCRFGPGSL